MTTRKLELISFFVLCWKFNFSNLISWDFLLTAPSIGILRSLQSEHISVRTHGFNVLLRNSYFQHLAKYDSSVCQGISFHPTISTAPWQSNPTSWYILIGQSSISAHIYHQKHRKHKFVFNSSPNANTVLLPPTNKDWTQFLLSTDIFTIKWLHLWGFVILDLHNEVLYLMTWPDPPI